jgi:hypothetical protein
LRRNRRGVCRRRPDRPPESRCDRTSVPSSWLRFARE